MRVRSIAIAAVLMGCSLSWGQDAPTAEQLQQLYDDALVQLKAAQDRKNELSIENERLAAQLAELQSELDIVRTKNRQLERGAAEFSTRNWFLRSHYESWLNFVGKYPRLKAEWEQFLDADVLTFNPLSAPATEAVPATQVAE